MDPTLLWAVWAGSVSGAFFLGFRIGRLEERTRPLK